MSSREIIGGLLDVARSRLEESRAGAGGDGERYWEAASSALRVLEDNRENLAHLSEEGLRGLLEEIGAGSGREAAVGIFEGLSARELIDDMLAGSELLRQDTDARERRRQVALSIVEQLGMVGARLVLSALA